MVSKLIVQVKSNNFTNADPMGVLVDVVVEVWGSENVLLMRIFEEHVLSV